MDSDTPIQYRQNKHVLFGQQEGYGNGRRTEFPFRAFTVGGIIPRSREGTDHIDNLQLLCGHYNSVKSTRPMDYLVAQLRKTGVLSGLKRDMVAFGHGHSKNEADKALTLTKPASYAQEDYPIAA